MVSAIRTVFTTLAAATTVLAHGHLTNIVVNGMSYATFDPTKHTYMQNPPIVVSWKTSQTDNGFIEPSAFAGPDIICHKNSSNALGHAVVAAGDRVFIQWDTWPESHKGPVMDYLARCGDSGCETVDKATLKFFKIDEVGLVDGSKQPGKWASDQLVQNKNSWLVQIPSNIAPGFYVLRHEIIALHSAGQKNGAQSYPQCINLQITGSGADKPEGVLGTALYTDSDPGILVNIYQGLSSYKIPGPPLVNGAVVVEQASSSISASATPISGAGTPVAQPTGSNGNGNSNNGNNGNNGNNNNGNNGNGLGSRPTPTQGGGQGLGPSGAMTAHPRGKITYTTHKIPRHAIEISVGLKDL
jgi:lytic cellulose monooxygenase (C1-hydroxylating)